MKIKTIITAIDQGFEIISAKDHDKRANEALSEVPNLVQVQVCHQIIPAGLHNHPSLVTTITHQ